ncbi:unnamed protein product [Caenorhabditis brenneri]
MKDLRKYLSHIIFIYIVLESTLFKITYGAKECKGNLIESIENACVVIIDQPLVIHGNVDADIIKTKLSSIQVIEAGLEIAEIEHEEVEFPSLRVIENKNGPAVFFNKNSNLKRFIAVHLDIVRGDPTAIKFMDDNFIWSVYEVQNKKSIQDFYMMAAAAKHSGCDDSLFIVSDIEDAESGFLGSGGLTLCLVFFNILMAVVLVFSCCCDGKKIKNQLLKPFNGKSKEGGKKVERKRRQKSGPVIPQEKEAVIPTETSKTTSNNPSKLSSLTKSPISNTPSKASEK